MPQRIGKNYWRFDNGLVTEASPLNPLDNSFDDCSNIMVNDEGSAYRRLGLTYEGVMTNGSGYAPKCAYLIWDNPANDSTARFIVSRVGKDLYIHTYADNADLPTVLSATAAQSYDMSVNSGVWEQTKGNATEWYSRDVDMTVLKGQLVVVAGNIDPVVISYDPEFGTFSENTLLLKERDFIGIEDDLDTDERPDEETPEHNYNLSNQGWTGDRLTKFQHRQRAYPSNADIPHWGTYTSISTGRKIYDGRMYNESSIGFGNTPAPKGHNVLEIFTGIGANSLRSGYEPSALSAQQSGGAGTTWDTIRCTLTTNETDDLTVGDRIYISKLLSVDIDNGGSARVEITATKDYTTTITAVASTYVEFLAENSEAFVASDSDGGESDSESIGTFYTQATQSVPVGTDSRCSVVQAFGGRLFYSGVDQASESANPRYTDVVWFSQAITDTLENQGGKCYQEFDPTAEVLNDVVDTDGGRIVVEGMGICHTMAVYGDSLILFSDKGVWEIKGSDGVFTPKAYSVRQVTNIKALPNSIVVTDGAVYYWALEGIYGIGSDPVAGYLSSQPVSEKSIDAFYQDIGNAAKAEAISVFDSNLKRVYWFYASSNSTPTVRDKFIVFNTKTGAVLPQHLADEDTSGEITVQLPMVSVDESDDDERLVMLAHHVDGSSLTQSLVINTLTNTGYVDAVSSTAGSEATTVSTDYNAYGVVGSNFVTADILRKTAPHVVVYMKAGSDEKVRMQAHFNFANSGDSGKWSTIRTLDGNVSNAEVAIKKARFRGTGYNVRFKITSVDEKPFTVHGWTMVGLSNDTE